MALGLVSDRHQRIEGEHVFCRSIGARSPILPSGVVLTLGIVHPRGLGWECWRWGSGVGSRCLARGRAPHALLEWAAIVDGEVALSWFAMVHTIDALDRAVAEEPTMLPLVGAFVGMVLGGVVGDPTDVAAGIFSWALALFHRVGEDVAAGTLFKRDELACEAHCQSFAEHVGGFTDDRG
jgi:hypothetical protein